jgi:hypothetical protein
MIQSIEKHKEEISTLIEDSHSSIYISPSETISKVQKKSPPFIQNSPGESIPIKYDIKIRNNISTNDENINNKSEEKNYNSTHSSSGSNSINESNDKKDFLEKKRKRRRNKCSYSNKKSNKKTNGQKVYKTLDLDDIYLQQIKDNEKQEKDNNLDKNEKPEKTKNGKKYPQPKSESCKKKSKPTQKELIAMAQKSFMEKIDKEYSDEQYNYDLSLTLQDPKAQFMKEHFPIMFRKDKYYLYTVLLKRRRTFPINFLQPKTLSQSIKESQKLQVLYENEDLELPKQGIKEDKKEAKNNPQQIDLEKSLAKRKPKSKAKVVEIITLESETNEANKINNSSKKNSNTKNETPKIKQNLSLSQHNICTLLSDTSSSEIEEITEDKNKINFKKTYNLLPKKVWSVSDDSKNIDIEQFYENCIQIWPFNECTFVKEIALEFLMLNNYSTEVCLKRIKEFVLFMKKRASELDISILNKNEKTVKKYSLRMTKHN